MFNGKRILVTGGTGSFGYEFVKYVLKNFNPQAIIVLSRDEMKQWEMAKKYPNEPRLRFFIGDVRDRDRLQRAFNGVDYVVHAAATKIVPTAEYNPFECVKTNVQGAMNVVDAAIDNNLKGVVALSTDKASSPINLYGATKLCSDKIFVAANSYAGEYRTRFSVVRYGNVMCSRGSVIPLFTQQAKQNGEITITDERMTRFMMSLSKAVEMVQYAFNDMVGGEIYVSKNPSMTITDIAKAVAPQATIKTIGIRPGEKMHEQMIGTEDAMYTYEYDNYYKILPQIFDWWKDEKRIKTGKKVAENFHYASDNNKQWMPVAELEQWLAENKDYITI